MLDGVFCFGGREKDNILRADNAKSSDDQKTQVLGMLKAADAYVQIGKLKESQQEVEAAIAVSNELNFREGRVCAAVLVAKIYARQGSLSTPDQLDEALDLAMEAQEKFERYGSKKSEAAALLALALVRFALEMFDDGHEAAGEARQLLEQAGDSAGLAEVLRVEGRGYLLQGREQRAAGAFGQVRELARRIGDKHGEADAVHKTGEALVQAFRSGRALVAAALDRLAEARALFAAAEDHAGEVAVLKTLQEFHLTRGKVTDAVNAGQQIVSSYHTAADGHAEGTALLDLASLLLDKKQVVLAHKVVAAAHQVAAKWRDGEVAARVGELHIRAKNAGLKAEIEESMMLHKENIHYPDDFTVEVDMARTVVDGLAETSKRGL